MQGFHGPIPTLKWNVVLSICLLAVLITPWCPDPSIIQISWSSMPVWHPKKPGKWPYPQHHHTHGDSTCYHRESAVVSTHSSTWLYVTGLERDIDQESNWPFSQSLVLKALLESLLHAERTNFVLVVHISQRKHPLNTFFSKHIPCLMVAILDDLESQITPTKCLYLRARIE